MACAVTTVAASSLPPQTTPTSAFSRQDHVPGNQAIQLENASFFWGNPKTSAGDHMILPDYRRVSAKNHTGWYTFDFSLATTAVNSWALYIPQSNINPAVYINNHKVEPLSAMGQLSQARNSPMYFEFPAQWLNPGANHLSIQVTAKNPALYLSPVQIGPAEILLPVWEGQYKLRSGLNRSLTVTSALLSIMLFLLWLFHRKYNLLFLCAACVFWGLRSLDFTIDAVYLSYEFWQWLNFAFLLWFTLAFFGFLNHRESENDGHPFPVIVIALALTLTLQIVSVTQAASFYVWLHAAYWLAIALSVWMYFQSRQPWQGNSLAHVVATLVVFLYLAAPLSEYWGLMAWQFLQATQIGSFLVIAAASAASVGGLMQRPWRLISGYRQQG